MHDTRIICVRKRSRILCVSAIYEARSVTYGHMHRDWPKTVQKNVERLLNQSAAGDPATQHNQGAGVGTAALCVPRTTPTTRRYMIYERLHRRLRPDGPRWAAQHEQQPDFRAAFAEWRAAFADMPAFYPRSMSPPVLSTERLP